MLFCIAKRKSPSSTVTKTPLCTAASRGTLLLKRGLVHSLALPCSLHRLTSEFTSRLRRSTANHFFYHSYKRWKTAWWLSKTAEGGPALRRQGLCRASRKEARRRDQRTTYCQSTEQCPLSTLLGTKTLSGNKAIQP